MSKTLVDTLKKKYGKKISMGSEIANIERLSTGSLALDIGLGGGIPKSRITTINGRESVCKTATAFHIIASAQRTEEKPAAFLSIEPADMYWAKVNGVDINKLVVAEVGEGEDAVDICEAFVASQDYSVVVFDSLGAIISLAELDGEAKEAAMLLRSKLIKRLMMKVNARLQPTVEARNDTAVVFLNHVYDKPDQYTPYVIAGGNAVRLFSVLIATFQRDGYGILHEKFKPDGKPDRDSTKIGNNIIVKIDKDKVAGKAESFNFQFFNKDGWDGAAKAGTFDEVGACIELGQLYPTPANPIIKKSGAWYTCLGKTVQGDKKLRELIQFAPELEDFKRQIKEAALSED